MTDCRRPLRSLGLASLLACGAAQATSLGVVQPAPVGSTTTVSGYSAPQGNRAPYTSTGNLALNRNVTVSGTISGYAPIHAAAFLTDGQYGNGSSWIDNSNAPAWAVIDLASVQSFDSLVFGRDRLGAFNDRDPGRVRIFSSLDGSSFTSVFDSSTATTSFNGTISGAESWKASFALTSGRYVKFQVGNAGAAIDEIEVYRSVSSVPEPSALLMALAGLPLLVGAVRRRRHTR